MEPADHHGHACSPQRLRAVHHARELIRLDADKADHAETAIVLDLTGDAVRPDARVGLVDGKDLDIHVLAKDLIFHAFLRDAEQTGERIGGQRRLPPLDDVPFVVVVRRLDKKKQKSSTRGDIRHVSIPARLRPPESRPAAGAFAIATVTSLRPNAQSRPGAALSPTRRVMVTRGSVAGIKITLASRVSASSADPLDEPVENSRPDLVLADQVLDPVFEVRVVVDLDDDDFPVSFLDVDAVKGRADRRSPPSAPCR